MLSRCTTEFTFPGMDDQGNIAVLCHQCVTNFDRLVGSWSSGHEEARQDISLRAVENEFARFKIWCGNLGALQRGSSSLDVRLRDSTVMRQTVLRFLGELQDCLDQCVQIMSGARRPWEESKLALQLSTAQEDGRDYTSDSDIEDSEGEDTDTSDEDTSELAGRQSEIQNTITHLYRLSFKMRNAGYRISSTKALALKIIDPDSGEDLFSSHAGFDSQHVLEFLRQLQQAPQPLTPNLEPVRELTDEVPAFLVERLSKAITNRRRYFAYWQRHALKLFRPKSDPAAARAEPRTADEAKQGKSVIEPHIQDRLNTAIHHHDHWIPVLSPQGHSLISGTEISKYQGNMDDLLETQTIISYATTARDTEGNVVDLPPPPDAASSQPEFICPYCWVACPSRQARGKPWRTHILQDLQPYVCTYPDCADGDCLFTSRDAWMEHERLVHRRRWRCFTKEHKDVFYNSKEHLHAHLAATHTGLTAQHRQSVLELAETTAADDRNECPFCLSCGPFEKGLYNHMAFHQERLAVFAAPRNTFESEAEQMISNNAQGIQSAGSLLSIPLAFSHSDTGNEHQTEYNSDSNDEDILRNTELHSASAADPSVINIQSDSEVWFGQEDSDEDDIKDDGLYTAIDSGDTLRMLEILENGYDIEARDSKKRTPLFWATEKGQEKAVRLLVERRANIEAVRPGNPPLRHETALSVAAKKGHLSIVKFLLENGAEANPKAPHQGELIPSPILWAVAEGHAPIVKLLLGQDRNPGIQELLINAAWSRNEAAVKLLLDAGAATDPKPSGQPSLAVAQLLSRQFGRYSWETINAWAYTPLSLAALKGHSSVVKLLLEAGADANSRLGESGETPLLSAASRGFTKIVKLLLDSGADLNLSNVESASAFSAAESVGQKPLHAAAELGHTAIVKLLLDKEADPDMRETIQPGRTPLIIAAEKGHDAVVKQLLVAGADIHVMNEEPLRRAAENGHTGVVKIFLDAGSAPDGMQADVVDRTPLVLAAENGHAEVIKMLLNAGADPHAMDHEPLRLAARNGHDTVVRMFLDLFDYWEPPLVVMQDAAQHGHATIVKMLLDTRADAISDWKAGCESALLLAAANGHEAVIKILLDQGAIPTWEDTDRSTPLLLAAEKGHEVVVEMLLDAGASRRGSALLLAAENGHDAVAKILLDGGADPSLQDRNGGTALELAAERGHDAVVRLLLEAGPDSKLPGNAYVALLLAAARNGHEAVVKLLVESGADMNAKDEEGYTALARAVIEGHESVVKRLLSLGAVVDEWAGPARQTPLMLATNEGHETVVELLLNAGAKLKARDSYGKTPLIWAAGQGKLAVVKTLLKHGAEVDSRDGYGYTPLICASGMEEEEIVQSLLKYGAAIEAKDNICGRTPLLWAIFYGREAVVDTLLRHGAAIESRDCYGHTPLITASETGNDWIVKTLLEYGATTESKDIKYGWTPLLWAINCSGGHEAVVKRLLGHGAMIELKDRKGKSISASEIGNQAIVTALLEHGRGTAMPRLPPTESYHFSREKLQLHQVILQSYLLSTELVV